MFLVGALEYKKVKMKWFFGELEIVLQYLLVAFFKNNSIKWMAKPRIFGFRNVHLEIFDFELQTLVFAHLHLMQDIFEIRLETIVWI